MAGGLQCILLALSGRPYTIFKSRRKSIGRKSIGSKRGSKESRI
jgi:hypothetical protein